METLHVLSGNVAVLNDIPSRYLHPGSSSAQSRDYLLPGRFRGQYVSLRLPEDSLSTGTLFLGKSRCGIYYTIPQNMISHLYRRFLFLQIIIGNDNNQ